VEAFGRLATRTYSNGSKIDASGAVAVVQKNKAGALQRAQGAKAPAPYP